MLDIDKWPWMVQLIAGLGVFVGGSVAAVFGNRIAGRRPSDEDDRQRNEREREERSRRYTVERELEMVRLEQKFEKVIEAVRISILGELEKHQALWREDYKALNARVTAVERGDVDVSPHPRRPRQ